MKKIDGRSKAARVVKALGASIKAAGGFVSTDAPNFVPATGYWSDSNHWAEIEKKDVIIKQLQDRLCEQEVPKPQNPKTTSKAARAARFTGLEDGDWGDSVTGRAKVAEANEYLNKMLREHIDSIGVKPQEPKTTVLQEAHDLIYGQREQDYGDPKKNLGDIANFWEMYLHGKYGAEFPLDASDICQMMSLLKMCRGFNGSNKRDSITDQAGYIGLIERVT